MATFLSRFPFASAFRPRRQGTARYGREATTSSPGASPAPDLASTRELELEEIRGTAMRRMFPKLCSWCASRWDRAVAVEVHNYLAGATSVGDLEQRIRHVERRRHFST